MPSNRTPMRERDPMERAKDFTEVALGYNIDEAQCEARRCIQCKNPACVKGCPVSIDIPGFIKHIKEGDIDGADDVLRRDNSLPAVCGRVCPQEEQCEKLCVLGIKGEPVAIGRLERFAADNAARRPVSQAPLNGKKVAVIGAGPAGLTCAGDLRKRGFEVKVFEAFHAPGGVMTYGIPEFRLPKALVMDEVERLRELGVDIELNVVVGRTVTVDELFGEGYGAVFIGSGAGLPMFMNIPGENLNGVYSANEYLTRINLMKAYLPDSHTPIKKARRVCVVGGGNVAMDAARSALRMGAEQVTIVYRRAQEDMPARKEELHHALDEGVIFETLVNPIEVLGENNNVSGLRCVRMGQGEPDKSGRRRPVPIEGSEFDIPCDQVIMSIGTSPNPLLRSTTEGLNAHSWGGLIVDEATMRTSREGVYAGGDAVSGSATVILAMGAGRAAAKAIAEFLEEKV